MGILTGEMMDRISNDVIQGVNELGLSDEEKELLTEGTLSEMPRELRSKVAIKVSLGIMNKYTTPGEADILMKTEIAKAIGNTVFRKCDCCNDLMRVGYICEDTMEFDGYYCSDECLNKSIPENDRKELLENESLYYTEWA